MKQGFKKSWLGRLVLLVGFSLVTLEAQPRLHLQHEDGRVGVWELDGIRFKASLMYEPPKPNPNARLVGAGDLDGDGEVDLVFAEASGDLTAWLLSGADLTREWSLQGIEGTVALVCDWIGDDAAELVTRSDTGQISVYSLQASGAWQRAATAGVLPDQVRLIGANDFDANGEMDLVVADEGSGVAVWLMRDARPIETVEWIPGGALQEGWSAVGAADFDRDDTIDIALQHQDGRLAIWRSAGTGIELLDRAPEDAGWRVAAVDDNELSDLRTVDPTNDLMTAPTEPKRLRGKKADLSTFSPGDPHASVPPFMEESLRSQGEVFLELWVH